MCQSVRQIMFEKVLRAHSVCVSSKDLDVRSSKCSFSALPTTLQCILLCIPKSVNQ